MRVLACEALLLAFCFLIHLVLWRIRRPAKQKSALIKIFFLPLIFPFALLFTEGNWNLHWIEFGYLAALHFAITFSYLVSYTLIEADGPTFLILLALDSRAQQGMTATALSEIVTDDLFIKHRLDGMVSDRLVRADGDRYTLTSKGEKVLTFFTFPRRLMGLSSRAG
jgi:hypothetical protein